MKIQSNWVSGDKVYRVRFYQNLLEDKEILDVGCANGYMKQDWIHKYIVQKSKKTLGLDIDKQAIENIKKKFGLDVIYGDAQNFELNQKFDLVHAGELIEHLDCPAGFLKSVHKHLVPDGKLILTTPNAYRIVNFLYNIFGRLEVNKEHTCWYCDVTLTQLLKRNNFMIEKIDYIPHKSISIMRNVASEIIRIFLPKRVAWSTLLIVAKPVNQKKRVDQEKSI
jgi:2-polyprenyl-3-methyl-5-hydroxy-6-metoxy-1,4-benzoquinol methylase